jgi:tetratricopeptide (TPR) repeat protein
MNYAWNEGWTAFMERRFPAALAAQERAAKLAPSNGEVLYDLAVIRLANGKREDALAALRKALAANPKLRTQASKDDDLAALRSDPGFRQIVR